WVGPRPRRTISVAGTKLDSRVRKSEDMGTKAAQRPDRKRPASAGGRSKARASPGKPVILLADDTIDARELYADYFSSRGFTVLTARDGAEATRVALEQVPDIIVMDLAMPQWDGVTAIQRIKADSRGRRARVILLTGYPHKTVERAALLAGADCFLTKPCLPEVLEQHVRQLQQQRPSP